MRICVDLDGTILTFNWSDWMMKGMEYFGNPKRNAKKALKILQDEGHVIIIHTCRINPDLNFQYKLQESIEKVKNILEEYQIPYDELWAGIGKPIADVYIDDRALKFSDWNNVLDQIMEN